MEKLLAKGVSLTEALKITNPSKEENYSKLQNSWEREGMESLMDLFKFYNNADVEPFCEAVEKCKYFTSLWKHDF